MRNHISILSSPFRTKSMPFCMLPLSSDLSASKPLASSSLNLPRGRYSCSTDYILSNFGASTHDADCLAGSHVLSYSKSLGTVGHPGYIH